MQLFDIKDVTKSFSENYCLNNFSFTIFEGDKINISGRSGIGKTTFFKLLLGFEQPDSGIISFKSEKYNPHNIWEIRQQIAYVPQDLSIGMGNTKQMLEQTLTLNKTKESKIFDLEKLYSFMDYFELPLEILQKNIEQLSGGEKQRLAIVNALLLERKIFFLDEISAALDKKLKHKTLDYFFLNPYFTVLSISHDGYLPDLTNIRTIDFE